MRAEKEKVLTEKQLLQAREEEIGVGLMRFHGRTRWEPSTEETPAHIAARTEGMPLHELTAADDESLEQWAVRNETVRRLFEYLSQDGPHPCDVLRRLYAVGAHMGLSPFCELTLRERSLIFGDSHESHRWLLKKICVKPLQRNGAKAYKAPGQKGLAASVAAHHAQQGNSNRANGSGAVARKKQKPPRPTRKKQ